jgi:ribosome-binding protein aMBF1 (putative translation factor)
MEDTQMVRIREERKKRGWNQTDLAYHSRVPAAEISRIESGRLIPTQKQLERIGQALGLNAKELAEAQA